MKLYTYRGQTKTLSEWATLAGVTENRMNARLARGWTIARAMGDPAAADDFEYYTYNGKTMTIHEWSYECGLNQGVIQQRLNYGWTLAQALGYDDAPPNTGIPAQFTTGIEKTFDKIYEYKGQRMKLSDWAKFAGMRATKLSNRLARGYSFGMAIEDPDAIEATRCYECNGKSLTIRQWEKQTGINQDRIIHRLSKGWTIEEALGYASAPIV